MRRFASGFIFVLSVFLLVISGPFAWAQDSQENCDMARNSADVMKCLTGENKVAEEKLNTAFDALELKQPAADLMELRDIQAHWVEYRNRECAQSTKSLENEPLRRLEKLRCLNRLTHARTKAINAALESEAMHVGEAAAMPRWVNALTADHPDVFWRTGGRIKGDFDCDDTSEYAVVGLRVDDTGAGVTGVISISENSKTGRPQSALVDIVHLTDASCGLLHDIRFEETETGEDGECANHIVVSTAKCPARTLKWNGQVYTFETQENAPVEVAGDE